MDACDDKQLVLLRYALYERDDLVTGNRVQSGRGLIQEKNLWAGDELACDTDPAFLATTESTSNGSADKGAGLPCKTEGCQQRFNSSDTVRLTHGAKVMRLVASSFSSNNHWSLPWQCQLGCKVKGLSDRERTYQSIFLFDIRADLSKLGN